MTKVKASTADQGNRFRDAAHSVGADEADEALDRVMGKLDLRRKPEQEKQKGGKPLGSAALSDGSESPPG